MDIYSRLEVLLGLKLLDFDEIEEPEKHNYQKHLDRAGRPTDETERLLNWYSKFAPEPIRKTSRRVITYIRYSTLILTVAAFFLGISAAGILFYYDGSTPINVLPVLTAFVLIPAGLLLASLVLPYVIKNRKTDLSFLKPLFEWLEGRTEKMIAGHFKEDVRVIRSDIRETNLIFNEPVQLFFKKTMQRSAAVYVSGALFWMLLNVTTTDLAFSWSSTLNIEADKIYQVTRFMAAPWSRIIPAATVDYDTVESTRFFRADRGDLMSSSSGQWWSFIFMCILVYGLLPRVAALLFFRNRLGNSLNRAIADSGYEILNLNRRILTVDSKGYKNTADWPDPAGSPQAGAAETWRSVVLLWYLSDVNPASVEELVDADVIGVYQVGGLSPVKDDLPLAKKIARESASGNHADIHIFVKYWESPTVRFEKTVKEIAGNAPGSMIKIIPVIEEADQNSLALFKKNWQTRLSALNSEIGGRRVFLEDKEKVNINNLV